MLEEMLKDKKKDKPDVKKMALEKLMDFLGKMEDPDMEGEDKEGIEIVMSEVEVMPEDEDEEKKKKKLEA